MTLAKLNVPNIFSENKSNLITKTVYAFSERNVQGS